MNYVQDSNGTLFIDGRYQVRKVARSFEDQGYAVFKRQTFEGNDYSYIPGEFFRKKEDAIRSVELMLKEEKK